MKSRLVLRGETCLALLCAALVLTPLYTPRPMQAVGRALASAGSPATGPGGSASPPSASSITPICGDPHPAKSLGPAPSLPPNPVHVIAGTFAVEGFDVTASAIYVFDGANLLTYSLSGEKEGSFALPKEFVRNQVSGPVVDPSGDIWLDSYYGDRLAKFSPSGRVLWSTRSYANSSIVGLETRYGFRVAVTVNTGHGYLHARLLTPGGRHAGTLPVALANDAVSETPAGDTLVSGGGYVRMYSPSWKLLSQFGDSHMAGASYAGSPHDFFSVGEGLQAMSGGPIYTLDPFGAIEETTPEGFLEATTDLGGHLQLSGGAAYLVNGIMYFAGGTPYSTDQNISEVRLSTLQGYLAAASPPTTLGWGAGITSGTRGHRVTGNYFQDGTRPSFYASFAPTWRTQAAHLQLSYSIWGDADVRDGTYPPAKTTSLPRSAKALAHIPRRERRESCTTGLRTGRESWLRRPSA